MAGRPRVPVDVLKARGSSHAKRDPNREKEMRGKCGTPRRPHGMNDFERRKWEHLVDLLKESGVLTVLDGDVLQMYVQSLSRLRDLQAKYKALLPDIDPGLLRAINQTTDHAHKLGSSLGLSPVARTRIHADKKEEAPERPKRERVLSILSGDKQA